MRLFVALTDDDDGTRIKTIWLEPIRIWFLVQYRTVPQTKLAPSTFQCESSLSIMLRSGTLFPFGTLTPKWALPIWYPDPQ